MRAFIRDLRHGWRSLARTRGFTITAVLVLALGIGTNTAIFTATNAFLFEPLGGAASGALVGVYLRDARPDGGYRPFSYPDYRDLVVASSAGAAGDGRGPFTSLAAQELARVGVTEGGVTRKTFACLASSSYFSTLGVSIVEGRAFLAQEDEFSTDPVVIVSQSYRHRNGAGAAVGRTVRINNRPFTIVGVAPEGFSGTTALVSPELWLPLAATPLLMTSGETGSAGHGRRMDASVPDPTDRSRRSLIVVGRLREGLSKEAAHAFLSPLASRLREAAPIENEDVQLSVGDISRLSPSAGPSSDSEVSAVLAFLMGMAAIVLLIACLNLANMLLARGGSRGREIAIRRALGGSRRAVVRQLMAESMLLSTGGAALGLLLSVAGTRLLVNALNGVMPFPIVFDSTPDARVLSATALAAAAGTVAFGLGPALRMSKGTALSSLKDQAGQHPSGAHGSRMKNLLVVGQLALCLALLSAAGLFVRGALAARHADPGFPLERGIVVSSDAALFGHDAIRGREAYMRWVSKLRGLPGIESASLASSVPFGTDGSYRQVRPLDGSGGDGGESWASTVVVGFDYFRTVGLPVLRGRGFTEAEESGVSDVRAAIVDLPMAQRLWPGEDPIGKRLRLDADSGKGWQEPVEIVGVVGGVRDGLFDRDANAHVYLPFGREYRAAMNLHVKLASERVEVEASMAAAIRRELAEADGTLPILSLETLREHRDTSAYMWMARGAASLFGVFGISALALAVLGVYGVKAYLVSRQTKEIGIRLALGATRLDVLALVLRDGMWPAALGLGAGAALAIALSKVLASWVYGVDGVQPAIIAGAAVVLAAAALLACYLPARRAMTIAPSVALRTE